MSPEPENRRIDNDLRRGTMSPELRARLRAIGTHSDDDLDDELRHLAVPALLRERLLDIGTLSDLDLDEELQHVPVEAHAVSPLAAYGRRRPAARSPLPFGLAAAALLAVIAGVAAWRLDRFERPGGEKNPSTHRDLAMLPDDGAGGLLDPARVDGRLTLHPERPLAPLGEMQAKRALELLERLETRDNLPLFDLSDANQTGEQAWPEILGSGLSSAAGPSFDPGVGRLVVRGLAPPRAKGYDLIFQLKHGVHPFVYPGSDKELIVSRAPLVTETASYDLVQNLVAKGRLPTPDAVRVEDFLAAMEYNFRPPKREALALYAAAGPSPFSQAGAKLLQIAVQAQRLPPGNKPTHLIVAVDVSEGMRWDGGWSAARRALAWTVGRMTDDDRLTLVLFNDRAWKVLDRASREEAGTLSATLASLRPERIASLAPAIELALEAAMDAGPPGDGRTAFALVLADQLEMDRERRAKLAQRLDQAARRQVEFHLIDLAGEAGHWPQLAELVEAGRGISVQPATSGEVRAALARALTGRSQRVARKARLQVRFDPRAVAAYRLLGHEATVPAGVIAPPLEVDLYSGETATALYEVLVRPGAGRVVADARLEWTSDHGNSKHRARRSIRASQFAESLSDAAPALQLAALAAEAAELFRGSYFAPPGTHSLSALLEVAEEQTAPGVRGRSSFQELLRLIRQARRARGP